MLTREMTLGEEIINLTKNGVDISTVERMYRKYIDLDEKRKSERAYVKETLSLLRDTVHIPYFIVSEDIKVGDKLIVTLGNLGNFTATVQKITNLKALFIFDDYITKRQMNEDGGKAGGYSKSDLKKWIDTELYNMFPTVLKRRMTDLSIPTVGEICGWEDDWNKENIEADVDAQLPLMKQRRYRVAYYMGGCEWGWLRNAEKNEFSSDNFAIVCSDGDADCCEASAFNGVRPEFWLVR